MADAIGPGQIARGHAGFHEGAGRPQRIGAGVDIDLAVDAEQRAVAVGGDDEVVGVVAGVDRGEQMLAAVLDPAHRMADLQRDARRPRCPPASAGSCRRSRRRRRARSRAPCSPAGRAPATGRAASRGRPGSTDRPPARRCGDPNRPARRGIRARPWPAGSSGTGGAGGSARTPATSGSPSRTALVM